MSNWGQRKPKLQNLRRLLLMLALVGATASTAWTGSICTVVTDQDAHSPTLPYREGYADWGQPTDPERWIQYSVVWFSRPITGARGQKRFQRRITVFDYGNTGVSGGKSKHNGAMGTWINGSLHISPLERIAFLEKVLHRTLPVRPKACTMNERIRDLGMLPGGWSIHGKTGTGSPREDGSLDPAHAYGWFVGWATKETRALVSAHLIRDEKPAKEPTGLRSREVFLQVLPRLIAATKSGAR